MLALLLACDSDAFLHHEGPPVHLADSALPPVDEDDDGWPVEDDCDDGDPDVHPDAEEVCDGVDADCDGAIDEGVPNDGAGCQDPGAPELPDPGETLHLMVRTGTETYDGTDDDTVWICVGTGWCYQPYRDEWDDLEQGEVDVLVVEDVGLPRAELEGLTVTVTDGSDRWEPVGFQVVLDGESTYCRDDLELAIGDASDETLSWQDESGKQTCDTVYDDTLTHGPILGAVTHESARIWFRTDSTRRTVLRVAETEDALTDAPAVHVSYPEAVWDFTDLVEVYGLGPETTWHYSLEVDGVTKGPWSFTTAPEPGTRGTQRIAFGSCTKDDGDEVWETLRGLDLDLFLFLGDNHYGNTPDLDDLFQWYRWAHEREGRRELMQEVPTLATWDDHDFVGNNTNGNDAGKEEALRAFTTYWANAGFGSDDTPGVWSRHTLGDVDLFLLDGRYWRDIDGFLGSVQLAWLLDGLEASDATFKLVASGSQFTSDGSSDSWAEYEADRTEVLTALVERGIEGVVWLSGDIHNSEFRSVPGLDGGYTIPELTSSPLANTSAWCSSDDELEACFASGASFVTLEIDTGAEDPELVARILGPSGTEHAVWTIRASELTLP